MADPKPLFDTSEPAILPASLPTESPARSPTPSVMALPGAGPAPSRLPETPSVPSSSGPVVGSLDLPPDRLVAPQKAAPQIGPLDLPDHRLPAVAAPTVQIGPLDLPAQKITEPPPPIAASALDVNEHPGVAQALRRGEETFPEIMQNSGFLVRNALNRLLPISFKTVEGFGVETLNRAAGLVDRITEAVEKIHEVRAAELLAEIVAQADPTRHHSLLERLSQTLAPFDSAAASLQIDAIRSALLQRLQAVDTLVEEMSRLRDTLSVDVATIGILSSMTDHADIGALVVRRGELFAVSLKEVDMALTQGRLVQKQVQEWVLRCDEVKTATLPALGFRAGQTMSR
jgi:hypothetical protein